VALPSDHVLAGLVVQRLADPDGFVPGALENAKVARLAWQKL
jgi:hypothetical protein